MGEADGDVIALSHTLPRPCRRAKPSVQTAHSSAYALLWNRTCAMRV